MGYLKFLFSFFLLFFFFLIAPSVLGFTFGGVWGLAGAALLVAFLFLFYAMGSESILLRLHQARRIEKEPGLHQTLVRVFEEIQKEKGLSLVRHHFSKEKNQLPLFYVYTYPVPQVLVGKSLGGRGSVLLSTAVLALLREDELRRLFRIAIERAESRGMVLGSLCAILASSLLRLCPQRWVQAVYSPMIAIKERRKRKRAGGHYLNPVSGLIFLFVFPFVHFLLKLGEKKRWSISDLLEPEVLNKIEGSQQVWNFSFDPGLNHLYLNRREV